MSQHLSTAVDSLPREDQAFSLRSMAAARDTLPPCFVRPRAPRVLLAGAVTAMTAPGGGETQLQQTCKALAALGVEARMWRPWEDSIRDADVLHLFGSLPEHQPIIAAAKSAKVPVVLSTIAWFDCASRWREPGSWLRRARGVSSVAIRRVWPRLPGWRRRLYQSADLLLPNSRAEASQLERLFAISADRMRVIPNATDERFFTGNADAFASRANGARFVLYAGRVEPRKNQLGFLKAMQLLRSRGRAIRTVILGDVVPGCDAYYRACRRLSDESVTFVHGLRHDNPLIASAYAACGCLALTSWFDTPGLVAIEAAAQGVPLVLTDRGATREYFGELAEYVSPNHLSGIAAAVERALVRPRSQALIAHVRKNYTWSAAAHESLKAYANVSAACREFHADLELATREVGDR